MPPLGLLTLCIFGFLMPKKEDLVLKIGRWLVKLRWWVFTPLIFILVYLASEGGTSFISKLKAIAFFGLILIIGRWSLKRFFRWAKLKNDYINIWYKLVYYVGSIPIALLGCLYVYLFKENTHWFTYLVLGFFTATFWWVMFMAEWTKFISDPKENYPSNDVKSVTRDTLIFIYIAVAGITLFLLVGTIRAITEGIIGLTDMF